MYSLLISFGVTINQAKNWLVFVITRTKIVLVQLQNAECFEENCHFILFIFYYFCFLVHITSEAPEVKSNSNSPEVMPRCHYTFIIQ